MCRLFAFTFCTFQSAHIHCNQKLSYPQKELKNTFSKFQFEKWSEPQRKKVIADVLKLSNQSQLYYTDKLVSEKLPTKERDFTRVLPRVLTLYIFSYLDPRTLCRCAQVCFTKIHNITKVLLERYSVHRREYKQLLRFFSEIEKVLGF